MGIHTSPRGSPIEVRPMKNLRSGDKDATSNECSGRYQEDSSANFEKKRGSLYQKVLSKNLSIQSGSQNTDRFKKEKKEPSIKTKIEKRI